MKKTCTSESRKYEEILRPDEESGLSRLEQVRAIPAIEADQGYPGQLKKMTNHVRLRAIISVIVRHVRPAVIIILLL
ncbi:hypothetical protein JYU34_022181 [Plutella xylostella]|uniref:Uncharacterized protein n=1 Tax=Plutella xylostella TaxID=51655 RepID=A0ABQ7PQF6_PLUXY|nr:hypothetical protein JYU34_022181 [Plutella xylostella]